MPAGLAADEALSRQGRRNQKAIVVAVFVTFGAFAIMSPILPLYVRELGVTDVESASLWSGYLFGVTPLVSALLGPLWGMVADRYGRKLVMQRSMVGFSVLYILTALTQDIFQLAAVRTASGIFGGFGGLSIAMAASIAPRGQTSRAIGSVQAAQILAGAVGPAVGGVLADVIGARACFLVVAALTALSLVVFTLLYKEEGATAEARAAAAARRLSPREIVQLPHFLPMLIVLFLVQFVDRSFGPQIPLYVHVLGTDPQYVGTLAGLVISVGAVGGAVSASYMGRLAGQQPPMRLLLIALAIGSLFCLPIAFVSSAWQLLILRGLMGLAAGGSMTLIYTIAGQFIPAQTRSTGYATLGIGAQIGGAVSPLAAGALAAYNIRGVFVLDAALYLTTIVWVLASLRGQTGAVAVALEGPARGQQPVKEVSGP